MQLWETKTTEMVEPDLMSTELDLYHTFSALLTLLQFTYSFKDSFPI